jgi:hypothetical protein
LARFHQVEKFASATRNLGNTAIARKDARENFMRVAILKAIFKYSASKT